MKSRLGLLLLLCLAVVLVQSESSIEVDENGDEYEVKRFNIQGRSLGEGRSQCVVTRRKRAPADVPSDAKSDEEDARKKAPIPVIFTTPSTPATNVDTRTSVDEEDNGDEGVDGVQPVGNMEGAGFEENGDVGGADNADTDNPHFATTGTDAQWGGDGWNGDGEGEGDGDGDESEEGDGAGAVVGIGVGGVSNNSPTAAILANQGLVVVHTNGNKAPVINSNSQQGVFQLVPVAPANVNGVGVYVGDGEQLHYEEEISPVSTTAIWSTGDDDYDDFDLVPKPTKGDKKKRPTKGDKNKDKKKKKKNKKDKNKKNKNKNKKGNKHRRPGNKNRRPLSNKRRRVSSNDNKRRRLPVNRWGNSVTQDQTQNFSHRQNANRRQNHQNHFNKNAHRRLHANMANRDINRKNKFNHHKADKGTRTFTKTETMTATGTPNDEKDVNCIYIRKDGATTARPFWNVWGRNANGAEEAARSGQFGKRKRINMRFVG